MNSVEKWDPKLDRCGSVPAVPRSRAAVDWLGPKAASEYGLRSLVAALLEVASLTLVMIAFLVLLGVVFNLGPLVVAERSGPGQDNAALTSHDRN
jgi:hypothetical protein